MKSTGHFFRFFADPLRFDQRVGKSESSAKCDLDDGRDLLLRAGLFRDKLEHVPRQLPGVRAIRNVERDPLEWPLPVVLNMLRSDVILAVDVHKKNTARL